jgi:hypothetical protein
MHADGHVHPESSTDYYSRTAWQIRRRLQDVRDGIVAGAGGEQAVTEARHRNRAYYDGHRLAERCKAPGLTQAQVAERIGGTIQISAVFGTTTTSCAATVTEAA